MARERRDIITRFGAFELDWSVGELRKRGLRIHLPEQPLAILETLLERAGQIVHREELRDRLWSRETFVDFDRGLNAGVTRLRQALGDSADHPRYLETIPRRGYRFIAPVSERRRSAEVASDSGVDAAMTGTLLRSGEQIRVATQLMEVPSGKAIWTHTVQVPLGEIFWLQDELTRRIIESLVRSVKHDERATLRPDIPASAQAYEYYLRANQLSQQMRDLPLARDFYLRCLEEDARYAPAWARIARCYRILAKFGADPARNLVRAEEAFQRAFALNPDLPGAQCLYAYHETEQGRAASAIVRLLKQLRNNRNDPELYAALVSACRYAGLIEASLAAHELGRRLDVHLRTTIMNTHFVMGNYELALSASTDNVGFMEAMVLDGLGRREEALARVRHRQHLPPLMQQWFEMLECYLEDRREEAGERLIAIDRQGFDPEGFHYRARFSLA